MAPTENESQSKNKLANQSIDYWKIAKIFLSRWYWVAGCILIGYLFAFYKIRRTQPIYISQAVVKIDNDDQAALAVPNAPLTRYYRPNLIQTEAIIMASDDVILKAIQRINYRITYLLEGRARTSDVYPFVPFNISIIQQDSTDFIRGVYHVRPLNQSQFQMTIPGHPDKWKTYNYGRPIETGMMIFSIVSPIPNAGKYSFRFNSVEDLRGRAAGPLSVVEQDKNTNVMRVTHTDINANFSSDILNAIIKQYVINDVERKKRSAQQTITYLERQLKFIDTNVNKAGDKLSSFQTKNNLIDPTIEKQNNSAKVSDFQQQIANLQLRQIYIDRLSATLRASNNTSEINLDLDGAPSTSLSGLLVQYNNVIGERNKLLIEFKPGSQQINEIDRRLSDLRNTISNNIRQLSADNKKTMDFYNTKLQQANNLLNQIPGKTNDFSKLENTLEISSKTRDLLIERQLSAQIASASVVPGATIVSVAEPNETPISPVERNIYSSFMFMGLLAGVGLIILIRMLNPYIYDVETVEGLTSTPIIGVILKYPEKMEGNFKRILSLDKPKSVFAESVRSVRTNLSFMASQKKNKVICVTSEISGEGKSFVTINLAGTLAIIDKKVIVIAADLRRSKLHKTFDSDNKKGLSTYLSSKDSVQDIIGHDKEHHIDYITSGPVPPNPSELLHSKLMDDLIEELKKTYEYIIIDTAPVGLVSDSIPLIRKADINLFIIRSGVSAFRAASIPERLSKEYSLNNIAIIINSFGNEKLHANIYSTNYVHGRTGAYYYSDYTGYGNYGYYDNEPRGQWWKFWKRK